MYTIVGEKIKIKEYCSKIYYPFYFNTDKYNEMIKIYKESNMWEKLTKQERENRKYELLPDVGDYLFEEYEDDKLNDVDIFKLRYNKKLINNHSEEDEILLNLKKLKLIDGNNKIDFQIEDIEIFIFDNGNGILTFNIMLSDGIANSTSPEQILNFNKIFKLTKGEKNNVELNKSDGSVKEINLKKLIDAVLSNDISKISTPVYEKGFINFRYVKFENYQSTEVFKRDTFGFMYYLMNMFNESDVIGIPDNFPEVHVNMPQGNIAFFFTLKGGGVFVYDNGSEFINNKFKCNIMENYSVGFLLSLYQRIAMLKLSRELTDSFLSNKTRNNKRKNRIILYRTEKILDEFRNFTAKCWFRDFSNLEGRNNFFKTWQKYFCLEEIFEEMRGKIQDINEYLRFLDYQQAEKARDNQNYIIFAVTIIFIPLNFFVGFMGMNIQFLNIENLDAKTTLAYLISIIIICWSIIFVIWIIKKIKEFLYKIIYKVE